MLTLFREWMHRSCIQGCVACPCERCVAFFSCVIVEWRNNKREKVILRRIVIVRMKSKGPLQEAMMGIRSLIFKFRLSFHHGVIKEWTIPSERPSNSGCTRIVGRARR